MANDSTLNTVSLTTNPTRADLAPLNIGDVVYLDGVIYTAREGVYMKVLDDDVPMPLALPATSATNFHCSPAAVQRDNGDYEVSAVTATASFRFSKWMAPWIAKSGARLIIGKGGMTSKDYKECFVPNDAIYLTTVGYGTGALLGRGVKQVQQVHWLAELGIAQAMWVLQVEKFGPFLVESDLQGNSLFERENAQIAKKLPQAYAGTKPAVLKRFGETDDRGDELI